MSNKSVRTRSPPYYKGWHCTILNGLLLNFWVSWPWPGACLGRWAWPAQVCLWRVPSSRGVAVQGCWVRLMRNTSVTVKWLSSLYNHIFTVLSQSALREWQAEQLSKHSTVSSVSSQENMSLESASLQKNMELWATDRLKWLATQHSTISSATFQKKMKLEATDKLTIAYHT